MTWTWTVRRSPLGIDDGIHRGRVGDVGGLHTRAPRGERGSDPWIRIRLSQAVLRLRLRRAFTRLVNHRASIVPPRCIYCSALPTRLERRLPISRSTLRSIGQSQRGGHNDRGKADEVCKLRRGGTEWRERCNLHNICHENGCSEKPRDYGRETLSTRRAPAKHNECHTDDRRRSHIRRGRHGPWDGDGREAGQDEQPSDLEHPADEEQQCAYASSGLPEGKDHTP